MLDNKLANMFLMEIEEMIVELEEGLVSLEKNPLNYGLINQIFRAAHTIKGGAGMAGYFLIVDFVHVMEDILDKLRSKKLTVTKEMISELLKAVDVVKQMKNEISSKDSIDENPSYQIIQDNLKKLLQNKEEIKESLPEILVEKQYEIILKLKPDGLKLNFDPNPLIEEISKIGKITSVINPDPTLWNILLKTKEPISAIKNIFLFISDDISITIQEISGNAVIPAKAEIQSDSTTLEKKAEANFSDKKIGEILLEEGKITEDVLQDALSKQVSFRESKSSSFIRVDTEKLDKLVNLVGELVTGVSQISGAAHRVKEKYIADTDSDDLVTSIESLDQISRDLQEQVMLVRMVPVEFTFNRFQRLVRDIANELGKKINLEMSGTETELDKNVIERLSDPLNHLIRNCVDHGIETPEERRRFGKDETGKIFLKAMQKGGNIIIEISDDGKGINRAKICEAARKNGLIAGDGSQLTDNQILNLIFEPGISTAEKITDLSGRGVGMDVVRRNIEDLRGRIDISSIVGKGTTFTIWLPLTLAIIDGMNVQVGTEILTVPLLSIIEQIRPKKKDIKTVEGKGELVNVRGTYFPLVRLHELFHFQTDYTDPTKALVLVLESEGRLFCLMVDNVLGEQQAVIKALDK
ncbi:MAG: chemotaxis protein CheA, partial [Desulfobacterales bacterium]|nr:chemotaxis protein CheA [Desulfobacterales bacterium]